MKLWIGTGAIEEWVNIFFINKPGPDKWCNFLAGRRPGEGYWGVLGYGFKVDWFRMDRAEAEQEFVTLPKHGTRELIEYEIKGNGRRVE
jgi:hypothetical protein